jgi:glyoxylase-like metal-dependent hydrolase (beta-lactamase superfamily II)
VKLFFHCCAPGFSNCYILGSDANDRPQAGRNAAHQDTVHQDVSCQDTACQGVSFQETAIIIDPGIMDKEIVNFIEKNNYTLGCVLITHDHRNHVYGLRTLRRIYNTELYAMNHIIMDQRTNMVRDREIVTIGPFSIEVISVPGHSSDSAVFRIGKLLFTGDALTAGLVGSSASSYGASVQLTALRSKILSLPGDFIVLPGHGPPSSLEAERRFNAGIQHYEQRKNQRPLFIRELFE